MCNSAAFFRAFEIHQSDLRQLFWCSFFQDKWIKIRKCPSMFALINWWVNLWMQSDRLSVNHWVDWLTCWCIGLIRCGAVKMRVKWKQCHADSGIDRWRLVCCTTGVHSLTFVTFLYGVQENPVTFERYHTHTHTHARARARAHAHTAGNYTGASIVWSCLLLLISEVLHQSVGYPPRSPHSSGNTCLPNNNVLFYIYMLYILLWVGLA